MQPHRLGSVSREYLSHLQKVADDPKERAIPLPLETLQRALGGLRPDEVTILGGFEGHGKSALAQQIAFSVAREFAQDPEGEESSKRVVFYHSLEMGRNQLMSRFAVQDLGAEDRLSLSDLLEPHRLDRSNWENLQGWLEEVVDFPLIIFDAAKQSLTDIGKAMSDLPRAGEGDARLVVIDYYHLLSDCTSGDEAVLSDGVRSLKDLARTGQCHILAIARLNRNIMPGQEPTARNLHGSQGMAYNADNVVFVHQPAKADHNLDDSFENKTHLIVDKARNGPIGRYELMWDPEKLKFRDPDIFEKGRRTRAPIPRATNGWSRN